VGWAHTTKNHVRNYSVKKIKNLKVYSMFKTNTNNILEIRKTRFRLVVLSLVFMHMFTAHSVWAGIMICFGDDGHFGIEAIGADHCCDFSIDGQTDSSENMHTTGAAQNGNCRDLPIDSFCSDDGNFLVNKEMSGSQTLSLDLVVNVTTPLTFSNTLKNANCISAPHLNIPLISFHTVSLLI
jgi:hypothetical protein